MRILVYMANPIQMIRDRLQRSGMTATALAAELGVTKQHLCDVLAEPPRRPPNAALLAGLGLERVVTTQVVYRRSRK